ncbi:hypothetical protein [Novacetimonas cocois]|uniref:Uncharacterized protein n=1 Tax=Novacetimonas cocois TaxID=1747507 RepID=A0A365YSZ2_9PROT|nr:hypothetical protein [Novacetimonas cocois]RBM05920.1 hypothetical protein NJLHNGOC_11675 [Novacetimonas cocois]
MRFSHLLAAASLFVTVQAHAAPTSPEQHGLFDGGAFPPSASGLATRSDLAAYAPPSSTYANLPASSTQVIRCTDCYIGSGSRGVLVLWNGSAWTGVSGEAVSH